MELSTILDFVLAHWPFFSVAFILGALGTQAKKKLWTDELAKKSRAVFWLRLTMPFHPVAVGALIGLIPGMPLGDGVTYPGGAVIYFAGAGVLSTWVYIAALRVIQRKGFLEALLDDEKEEGGGQNEDSV